MYRETIKKSDQAEAVSIQLNRFEPEEGMSEYQLLLSGIDPTLPFTEQAEHLWQAYIRVMRGGAGGQESLPRDAQIFRERCRQPIRLDPSLGVGERLFGL